MRAYFFGNMYLSSIQQGLQAAHVLAEMFVKYETKCIIENKYDSNNVSAYLKEWGTQHKTIILLNGGYSETLNGLCNFFDNVENPYPWSYFNEGQDALNGALTSVGIILPERIYETANDLKKGFWRTFGVDAVGNDLVGVVYNSLDYNSYGKFQDINEFEKELIERLSRFDLAR